MLIVKNTKKTNTDPPLKVQKMCTEKWIETRKVINNSLNDFYQSKANPQVGSQVRNCCLAFSIVACGCESFKLLVR